VAPRVGSFDFRPSYFRSRLFGGHYYYGGVPIFGRVYFWGFIRTYIVDTTAVRIILTLLFSGHHDTVASNADQKGRGGWPHASDLRAPPVASSQLHIWPFTRVQGAPLMFRRTPPRPLRPTVGNTVGLTLYTCARGAPLKSQILTTGSATRRAEFKGGSPNPPCNTSTCQ
jgi:hypothetical protein